MYGLEQSKAQMAAQGMVAGYGQVRERDPMPVPSSEIDRECERLAQNVAALGELVSMVGQRMSPLIVPTPEGKSGTGMGQGCGSHLGQRLNEANGMLVAHMERLRGVMDSLAI